MLIEIRVCDTLLKELDLLVLREYWGLILLVVKHLTCTGMDASVQVAVPGKVKASLGSGEDGLLQLGPKPFGHGQGSVITKVELDKSVPGLPSFFLFAILTGIGPKACLAKCFFHEGKYSSGVN